MASSRRRWSRHLASGCASRTSPHLMTLVPYSCSGSILRRWQLFMSAVPARPKKATPSCSSRGPRLVLEQEDVGHRVTRADHRHRARVTAPRAPEDLARQLVDLADGPGQVLVVDLVGLRHAVPLSRGAGSVVRVTVANSSHCPDNCGTTRIIRALCRRIHLPPSFAGAAHRRLEQFQRLQVDASCAAGARCGSRPRASTKSPGPVKSSMPQQRRTDAGQHVGVAAGGRRRPISLGEALGELVEAGEREPRVEDLDHVDVGDVRSEHGCSSGWCAGGRRDAEGRRCRPAP